MMGRLPFYKMRLIGDKKILKEMLDYFLSIQWTSDKYIIHGKEIVPKRKTYMYGKKYSYSGINKEAVPFDQEVKRIASMIEKKLSLEDGYFNACLANLYPDGEAGLSYHKDNEEEMDKEALIVSISFGATRNFNLKEDLTGKLERNKHKEGEIIIMEPDTQEYWRHAVPKQKSIKDPRISLTFRKFK